MAVIPAELGQPYIPPPDIQPSASVLEVPAPRVNFGNDPVSLQAEHMGKFSGVPFTRQEQLDAYRAEEQRPWSEIDPFDRGDQHAYRRVLKETGEPVDLFEAAYPSIIFPPFKES